MKREREKEEDAILDARRKKICNIIEKQPLSLSLSFFELRYQISVASTLGPFCLIRRINEMFF